MKKQRYKKSTNLTVGTMVQGMIGENIVANLFLKNGYIVTRPDVDLGVDMVVCKPKKWGKRMLMKNWISIQVKYSTRISETTFGTSLRVKVTANNCDYVAIPLDKGVTNIQYHHGKVIFYPQPLKLRGKEYLKEFAFYDSKKANIGIIGNFKNQNKRRWAHLHFNLPR